MVFNKKNKESTLPDLPGHPLWNSLPSMQNSPKIKDNLDEGPNKLPTLPDSAMNAGFSQTAIKDAMTNEPEQSPKNNGGFTGTIAPPEETPQDNEKFKLKEMEEWSPPPQSMTPIPPFEEQTPPLNIPPKIAAESKPIFVRLDKFNATRTSLEKIESSLAEIEELLKGIKDVKHQEEQELSSWEKEMENIKARLSNVLTDIFDRGPK